MGKLSKALEKTFPNEDGDSFSNIKAVGPKQTEVLPATPPKPQYSDKSSHIEVPQRPFNSHEWDGRLKLATKADSTVIEAFKRLRNKILFPASGTPPKTILITSAIPGEGKGFVCANLGVVMAQGMEHYSLMVDCDLRRPTLANLFGVSSDLGLVNHLKSNTPLERIIFPTGHPKLSLIPSGPPPDNPAELLNSNRMIGLIEELTSRYQDRFILLDTPPFLAASETTILAKHVDAVILVVRWGHADREQVKDLVDTLGKDKIAGLVFNAYEANELEVLLSKKGHYGYKYDTYYYNRPEE